MLQNIIIITVLIICAWFVGRRIYTNISGTKKGSGCNCGCSGCDPDLVSTCQTRTTDPDPK